MSFDLQRGKLDLESSLSYLPGVDSEKARLMDKEMGCSTIEDLLYYFPRRYLDRTISKDPYLQTGQELTLMVQIKSVYLSHGKSSRLIAHCQSQQGRRLDLIWFRGTKYFRKVIQKDMRMVVSGKLQFFRALQMVHPDYELLDAKEEMELVHTGRIIPLYPLSETLKRKDINSRSLRRLLLSVLDRIAKNSRTLSNLETPSKDTTEKQNDPIPEILPFALLKKYELMRRCDALRSIHFPESEETQKRARIRLKYEELYLFQVLMYHKALMRQKIPRFFKPLKINTCKSFTALRQNLSFTLTKDQEKAIDQIVETCQAKHPYAFLLQGDVGSGKTLVAMAVALHYLEAGIQTALLAPTEILARQHFLSFNEFLDFQTAQQVELLIGSSAKQERMQKLERIAVGEAGIVIGTHTLIEENLVFKSLGLVIIDEQQRFGVKQREALYSKGKYPDSIAMSATPIPRSLCLTEFADLDLVSLREKPAGRKPIKTMYFKSARRPGVYNSVRKHVSSGRQCYIVYPLIEESEKLDLQAASLAYEELRSKVFPEFNLGLLHGRMKDHEKKRIMLEFRNGKIQILVSTSVIEVGVDVPNASIIIIEHAERFGIAQLHQFRGRVGRGSEQSYCVLISDAQGTETQERLQALVESEDGFYLAEMDLKIRGTGEILGLRQHGLSELRLTDLLKDRDLSERSYADARAYPEISSEARRLLCRRFSQGVVVFPN